MHQLNLIKHFDYVKNILIFIAVCTVLFFSGKAESYDNKNIHPWEPPSPSIDNYDWIQLTSKEWLKGDLEGLYGNRLEFDSDKLGYLEFEWTDVRQVRSHDILTMRFDKQIIVSGYLTIVEDRVLITNGDEKKDFDRTQLVSITSSYSKIIDLWKTQIGLGLNILKGNTDQIQYNMKANLKRRSVKTEFEFDYLGNYVSTDNIQTSESQRISSNFDMFKTRNFFLRLIHAEYYRDPFQNIKYRETVGAGIGLDLIDTYRTSWNIKTGPAYQKTRFKSVEEGKDSTASTLALLTGTSFDKELSGKLDFLAQYTFYIVNRKSGLYMHHAVVTLETELTDVLDFDISIIWDRTQRPVPKSDGTIPEKDDFKLIFSIAIDF